MDSLIYKWLPSENASSYKTKKMGNKIRKYLKLTHKEYRKLLAWGREKENILERLMSENKWTDIDFSKIPSRAGLIYKNAFARRDLIAKKYETFVKAENTKVNAKALYPYDVVAKATKHFGWGATDLSDVDRAAIEKYWNALPNYCGDQECNMLCVCDTSGSMTGSEASAPINIAISLSMYAAERAKGAFQNHYISFASRPQLIKIRGVDFVDKVQRIYETNLIDNTNLTAVFDLLKNMVLSGKARKEDLPSRIVVISDMEIDSGASSGWGRDYFDGWSKDNAKTEMEKVRQQWAAVGLELPKLVYWNVDARDNTVLDLGPDISLCSGASATLFEQIMKGVSGKDLMLDKLMSKRYEIIQ